MASKGSAAGFAAKRPDHLLPEGRRWPPKGQQEILQQRGQITYILRAGNGHQRVSSRFYSKETRSLTYWEQEMATNGSEAGFTAKRPDHLLPEGRRWPPMGQQQFCNKETRSLTLWARNSHQRVSSRFCSKETRSLTSWRSEMVTKRSAENL